MATSSRMGFPCVSADKESTCIAGDLGFDPWVGKIPRRRKRLPTPVFWPGEFLGLYRTLHGIEKSWTTFTFTFPQDTNWGSWIWDSCFLGEDGRLAIKERNNLLLLVATLAHMLFKIPFFSWIFFACRINFRLVTVEFICPSKSTIYKSASDDLKRWSTDSVRGNLRNLSPGHSNSRTEIELNQP